jgi:putative flippase GtrA
VFRKKGKTAQTFLAYCLLAACILVGNTLLLQLFVHVTPMSPYIAKLVVEAIMFVVSFVVQKFIIFRPKKNKK